MTDRKSDQERDPDDNVRITRPSEGSDEKEPGTVDSDALVQALRDSTYGRSAPDKLVSETALEEPVDEEQDQPPLEAADDVPEQLTALREALAASGFSPELRKRPESDEGFELHFDLMAGRSTRTVAVDVGAARVLLETDVSAWRSLQRYDGIWSESEGIVEIALRGERFGLPLPYLLRRLSGLSPAESSEDAEALGIELTDSNSGVSLRIGEASDIASALLSVARRPRRRFITLRVSNVAVSTSGDADNLAQLIADTLSFDLDMAFGALLMPQRLENRNLVRGRSIRRTGRFSFPRNSYPHEAVLLYQAGRDKSTAPLIRYWSLYQVLEYFFPKHTQAEALRQLSRHLRSPAFDPFRDEDVLKAVQLATSAGKGFGSEEEQLLTTLRAITSPEEVVDLATMSRLKGQLEDRKCELTNKALKFSAGDELMPQLAQRIYDIRCRIVHSKSASQRDSGPGLLPGTHHDDLVRNELPLMEFLAQQALVSAAEPLMLPPRGTLG